MCITCVLFIGVGCFGAASIFITQHIPSKLFAVLRLVDLEVLSSAQLEDVQNEMKFSQMLQHPNIAGYLHSFVVGSKLWAIQSLMHYGKSIYLYIYMYVFEPVLSCDTCTYWLLFSKIFGLHVSVLLIRILYCFSGSCADIMHSAQPFRNGFKESVIAHILRDVITGLDYLHTLGYVHRYMYVLCGRYWYLKLTYILQCACNCTCSMY